MTQSSRIVHVDDVHHTCLFGRNAPRPSLQYNKPRTNMLFCVCNKSFFAKSAQKQSCKPSLHLYDLQTDTFLMLGKRFSKAVGLLVWHNSASQKKRRISVTARPVGILTALRKIILYYKLEKKSDHLKMERKKERRRKCRYHLSTFARQPKSWNSRTKQIAA